MLSLRIFMILVFFIFQMRDVFLNKITITKPYIFVIISMGHVFSLHSIIINHQIHVYIVITIDPSIDIDTTNH